MTESAVAPPLVGILAPDLDAMLPTLMPHLNTLAGMSRGRYSAADFWRFLQQQKLQVWVHRHDGAVAAMVLTEIVAFPQHSEALIVGGAGFNVLDPSVLSAGLDHLAAWARSQGCKRLTVVGRLGWARALPDMKFRDAVLERDL